MSDSFIPVGVTGKDLQTYLNTVGGRPVHSEAVTPTDQTGAPFTTSNPVPVSGPLAASATVGTGLSTFRDPALSNTAVAVKAGAGKVHGHNLFNPGTALAYVHYYDVAQGSVVVGTTVPKLSIALPSNASASIGTELFSEVGLAFATAISIAASTTPAGGTAPGTALVANVYYI